MERQQMAQADIAKWAAFLHPMDEQKKHKNLEVRNVGIVLVSLCSIHTTRIQRSGAIANLLGRNP